LTSRRALVVLAAAGLLAAGCSDDARGDTAATPTAPDFLVTRLGGTTSAKEFRGRPFNQSARSLDNAEFRRFGTGATAFDKFFTTADGLGPTFNEDSCLSCHLDGVVEKPHTVDDPGPGLLLRMSVPGTGEHGGPKPEPTYGTQLQTNGAPAEGHLKVTWKRRSGRYPDGTRYDLRVPAFAVSDLSSGPLASDVMTSARIAAPITGMGLLEAVPVADLESAADPDDRDQDGISGRLNHVWDAASQSTIVGRFGWKAGQPTVLQQSVGALHDDMGITTSNVPDPCHNQGSACAAPPEARPDMSDQDVADQVFYNRTIAVPIARNVDDPPVIRGAKDFVDVGCASCHTTTQRSGPDQVKGLANQTFHPFTDLLLHDMGPGLADGRPEFEATGSEWRTAPLWGFSRRAATTGFSSYLHDGRARSAEEAILWHDGEARASRRAFMALPKSKREDLLKFLGSI
jgi:CxxC motif-containing protein (DUF1111 family)